MKRLALTDFVKKQATKPSNAEHLLGQVLGNCHDDRSSVPRFFNGNPNDEDG